MSTTTKNMITISTMINAPVEKVWNTYTDTNHIVNWNSPSPDWHSPRANHDFREGGEFNYRMEARDGSMGFDFGGVFDVIRKNEYIEYTIGDGRKVMINFLAKGSKTEVKVEFEAETINSVEMQRGGWQAILDNFGSYTEKIN
jgi:uncharacterized protein YndB with AHSA1/START domain